MHLEPVLRLRRKILLRPLCVCVCVCVCVQVRLRVRVRVRCWRCRRVCMRLALCAEVYVRLRRARRSEGAGVTTKRYGHEKHLQLILKNGPAQV